MTDRDLDVAIAEKVMGWCWQTHGGYRWFAPESDLGVRKRWCNSQLVDIEIRRADRPADEYVTEDPWWLEGETRTSGPAFKDHVEMCHVVPRFSTSIADAWLVALHLQRGGHTVDVGTEYHQWVAIIDASRKFMAKDDSAPRAICIAALRALGVEVQP